MLITNYSVKCESGLHARPASELAQLAQTFPCDITIVNKANDMQADAKSIIEVLCLGADKGANIDIITNGEREDTAVREIIALLDSIVS